MSYDFESLCQLLGEQLPDSPAATLAGIHGLGCGLFSAGLRPDFDEINRQLVDFIGTDLPADPAFAELFETSLEMLGKDQFDFSLCLPDDDYSLAERANGLRAWCHGFLHGFAASDRPLSSESRELLQDLVEISRLDTEALEAGHAEDAEQAESGEIDYIELYEFVRMAAISLFLDHNTPENPSPVTKHVQH